MRVLEKLRSWVPRFTLRAPEGYMDWADYQRAIEETQYLEGLAWD